MSRAQKVGLLLLQLLLNSSATDIVLVTLFCTAVETAIAWYTICYAMARGHCLLLTLLLFWRRSTASSVFRVGARGRAVTLLPASSKMFTYFALYMTLSRLLKGH